MTIIHPPLILTLALDPVSTGFFDDMREKYFPRNINYLKSHLTLFHKLPLDQPEAMLASSQLISEIRSFDIEITNMISLGKGVAYQIGSDKLLMLRKSLREIWKPWLSPQDSQGFRPHITVQNKVEPKEARELLETLSRDFKPFTAKATGVNCFEYLNGPWGFKSLMRFQDT